MFAFDLFLTTSEISTLIIPRAVSIFFISLIIRLLCPATAISSGPTGAFARPP
jgi:hypothetical protein